MQSDKPIVIFGDGPVAEAAHFYFTHDMNRTVAGFTLDNEYIQKQHIFDKPIVGFEDITTHFPPSDYDMFIALGYNKINKLRKKKFEDARAKGYRFASYISPRATVWPKEGDIGENCFIHDHNVIQPFTTIGDNVVMWTSNVIGHNCIIEDHCFITGHTVISGLTRVGEGSFIGVNATLRDGLTIGKYNVIGAGALILNDTNDEDVFAVKQTPLFPLKSSELKSL